MTVGQAAQRAPGAPSDPQNAVSSPASGCLEGAYRLVFDHAPMPMWVFDEKTFRFIEVNAAALEQYGYSRDEFLALEVVELLIDPPVEELARLLTETAPSTVISRAGRHRRKDGTVIEVEIAAHGFPFRDRRARLVIAKDVTAQRQAEAAIRESERRAREQFIAMPVPTYAWRRIESDFELIDFNAAAESLTAGAIRGWVGRRASEMFAERMDYGALMRQCLRENRPVELTVEHRLVSTGELKDFVVTFVPIQPDLVLIHTVDETERRAAEQALRTSEERYRALTENTSELVAIFDLAGAFQYASPSYETVLGYRPSDIIGTSPFDLIHPDDVATCQDVFRQILANEGKVLQVVFRLRARDGDYRRIEVTGQNLVGHPAVRGIVANGRDVTARFAAESELRFQAHLLDAVEQAVIATTLDGTVVYWNRFAEKLYGWSAREAHERDVVDLIVADAARVGARRLLKRASGGEGGSVEFQARARDGREFDALITTSPIHGPAGEVVGVVGVSMDVSERARLSNQLRQAQKMEAVGRLAGGVAHDFNNLLTVIGVHAAFLLQGLNATDGLKSDAIAIQQAGDRAAALTRQLLAFSRKQILKPAVIDLNSVVEEANRMLERLVGDDVEIALNLARDLKPVVVDAGQIEQVLMNLVLNARDAMPSGGRIVVDTREALVDRGARLKQIVPPGRYAVLAVSDGGVGMNVETQARVFEPFFTTKELGKGTGLGLATVYGIVKQSSGYILLDSAPGRGTTFEIFLPFAADTAIAGARAGEDSATARGAETILLVEDDPSVRKVARRLLVREGYTILEASNGSEAVALSQSHPGTIDLVVSDAVMPGMSGAAVVAQVRSTRPGCRAILMSGYTDDEMTRRGISSADMVFLQKPFTPSVLARHVRTALDG